MCPQEREAAAKQGEFLRVVRFTDDDVCALVAYYYEVLSPLQVAKQQTSKPADEGDVWTPLPSQSRAASQTRGKSVACENHPSSYVTSDHWYDQVCVLWQALGRQPVHPQRRFVSSTAFISRMHTRHSNVRGVEELEREKRSGRSRRRCKTINKPRGRSGQWMLGAGWR